MLPFDVKHKIVEALKSLGPEKIILFGSHAYGYPQEESDIDLFVIKNMDKEQVRDYRLKTKKLLWQQFCNQNIRFDVLVDSEANDARSANDSAKRKMTRSEMICEA